MEVINIKINKNYTNESFEVFGIYCMCNIKYVMLYPEYLVLFLESIILIEVYFLLYMDFGLILLVFFSLSSSPLFNVKSYSDWPNNTALLYILYIFTHVYRCLPIKIMIKKNIKHSTTL